MRTGKKCYRNFYHCYECDHEWTDDWDAMPDDDCPNCGARHVSPYKTEDIPEDEQEDMPDDGLPEPTPDDFKPVEALGQVAMAVATYGAALGIKNVTYENDHKSGEMIFEYGGVAYVIRSRHVLVTDPE